MDIIHKKRPFLKYFVAVLIIAASLPVLFLTINEIRGDGRISFSTIWHEINARQAVKMLNRSEYEKLSQKLIFTEEQEKLNFVSDMEELFNKERIWGVENFRIDILYLDDYAVRCCFLVDVITLDGEMYVLGFTPSVSLSGNLQLMVHDKIYASSNNELAVRFVDELRKIL